MIYFLFWSCTSSQDSATTAEETIQEVETITAEDYRPDIEFSTAKECGECHPTHYEEWRQSMHAYAAHSPVFDAMAQKAFRDTSGEVGNFCTSCHSPIGAIQGETGASVAETRSEISKDSVSCEVCHSAVNHGQPVGNLSLAFTTSAEKYGPYGSEATEGHESEYSELHESPELCGSCHDVFNFPGLRIEEAYTEYAESPAQEQGLTCQDCHMGTTPGQPSVKDKGPIAVVDGYTYPERDISSHRFIGPDYSLLDTFPYPDDLLASAEAQQEMFTQIQQLLENSVQISDIRGNQEEINGEMKTVIEVDIESLVSGHHVPTGFTSERQLWLEITITNNAGSIILVSGHLDPNGDLYDIHSDEVRRTPSLLDSHLVNFQSKNVKRQGIPDAPVLKEVVFPFDADYIEKHSLKPLEKRTVRYALSESIANYSVATKLHYRNLPPYLLRALQLEELLPRIQIFTLDEMEKGIQ